MKNQFSCWQIHGNNNIVSLHNRVETSNGISQKETGRLIQPKSSDASPAYVAEGEYQFLGQDNVLYKVRYTADEFGNYLET